jgi:signal transduction histidine kinase
MFATKYLKAASKKRHTRAGGYPSGMIDWMVCFLDSRLRGNDAVEKKCSRKAILKASALLIPTLAPCVAFADEMDRITEFTVPLLSFALGAGGMFLATLFWRRRHIQTPDEDRSRIALLFSSSHTCFYYQNLTTQKEWFSRKLKTLLQLTAKHPDFTHFGEVLEERDYEKLKQSIVDLKAGSKQFRLDFKLHDGKMVECYGVIQQEHDTNHLVLWWQDISERNHEVERVKKENERIKQELQHLGNLLNALPIPVWQRDKQLQMKFCNLAFMEAVEESGSDQQSESLELYSQAKALAQKALTTGMTAQERRFIILHGERKMYDLREVPWSDGQSTTGVALDMQEMEAVREEMERIKSAQSDLLESTNSAMAIYGTDQRLLFFNQAFVNLWKLDEAWLVSHPKYSDILEKLRDNRNLPEQANFPAFKQQQLKLFSDLIASHEEFYYLPDGRTIRALAIPHTLGGVLFAYEDVTDRLALERSYNTLIAVQKETLDNLHEGVAVFGEDGRLKLSNPNYIAMWNLSPEIAASEPHLGDLLERNKPLFLFDEWEKFKQDFLAMMSKREMLQQRIERRDGKFFEIITVPLPDGQTLLNYVDVTNSILVERSLREKNEILREADRLKSEFLANVSYELRSPLTTISGFTEMLQQDYLGHLTARQQAYLSNIHEASKHLTSLIDDILDIASIEAGYMQLEIKPFDIGAMMASMLVLVGERARQTGIILKLECEDTIGEMEGDENRIRQVLFNLLTNSIQYTESGKQIILGASHEAESDSLLFWVEDQGMGIRTEEHDSVFSKFYRTSDATRKHSGTGLGLSMVKSFVELHGGSVALDSTLGIGTKITCRLPRKRK